MPDRYPHPDPDYLRDLAARDPIGLQLVVRNWRNAYVAAMAKTFLLSLRRHIRRRFKER